MNGVQVGIYGLSFGFEETLGFIANLSGSGLLACDSNGWGMMFRQM